MDKSIIGALVIGLALGYLLGSGLPKQVTCKAASEVSVNTVTRYPAWLLDCTPDIAVTLVE